MMIDYVFMTVAPRKFLILTESVAVNSHADNAVIHGLYDCFFYIYLKHIQD